jgi:hypothetical protein
MVDDSIWAFNNIHQSRPILWVQQNHQLAVEVLPWNGHHTSSSTNIRTGIESRILWIRMLTTNQDQKLGDNFSK